MLRFAAVVGLANWLLGVVAYYIVVKPVDVAVPFTLAWLRWIGTMGQGLPAMVAAQPVWVFILIGFALLLALGFAVFVGRTSVVELLLLTYATAVLVLLMPTFAMAVSVHTSYLGPDQAIALTAVAVVVEFLLLVSFVLRASQPRPVAAIASRRPVFAVSQTARNHRVARAAAAARPVAKSPQVGHNA